MKPINYDNASCNPISSNCVIWQGPDIPCINLCKGDTVSDVVFKLATELCGVLEQIDVTTLDLSCFNLAGCEPKDLQAFLQFLIDKICALEACCDQTPSTARTGCPDCVVNIAPCFYYQDQFGNQITTMQLSDYVTAIGNRVCDILNQIDIINQTLVNYNIRITALENAPAPTFTIPTVTPNCVLPSVPTEVQIVVDALEAEFCLLQGATGTPTDIYTAIAQECPNLSTSPILGPGGGNLGSLSGWINPVTNLADSINNMWLVICDLRAAVRNIQENCCPSGCDGITLTVSAVITGGTGLRIYINGTIPSGFVQCNALGTLFTISDTLGNSFTQYIDVVTNLNNAAGVLIDLSATPVNPASNLKIEANICLCNATTNAECCNYICYDLNNEAACPTVVLTPDITSIAYTVTPVVSGTYTIQLYNNAGTTLIAQNITAGIALTPFSGSFTGLTASTPYKIRVLVTVGSSTTTCPFEATNTLPGPCPPPTSVTAVIATV